MGLILSLWSVLILDVTCIYVCFVQRVQWKCLKMRFEHNFYIFNKYVHKHILYGNIWQNISNS